MDLSFPIRVFIGYDHLEPVAYHVLCHSIQKHASVPVSVTPLKLEQLTLLFDRGRDPKQSTDFSFTRFLVPALCDYAGWAVFMDADMLFLDDIAKLWVLRDPMYAVMCVKHAYAPKADTKMLGQRQTRYEKKLWSSLMMFNNAKCRTLTPEYVNSASGLELHRFQWTTEDQIGELPADWNVPAVDDYDSPHRLLRNIHYTSGGPWWELHRDVRYAEKWLQLRAEATEAAQELESKGET